MRGMLSWSSEYVRMTIMCPTGIVHPAKGDHLTVSIANYAHHNDSGSEGASGVKWEKRNETYPLVDGVLMKGQPTESAFRCSL